MCYEITYPFPNFNGVTIEVWEWISNSISHFKMDVSAYICWDKLSHITIKGPLLSNRSNPRVSFPETSNFYFNFAIRYLPELNTHDVMSLINSKTILMYPSSHFNRRSVNSGKIPTIKDALLWLENNWKANEVRRKNIERHTADTIVSWPNPKQWVIVHTSDLIKIIRQNIYILSIITRDMGKLKTYSPT